MNIIRLKTLTFLCIIVFSFNGLIFPQTYLVSMKKLDEVKTFVNSDSKMYKSQYERLIRSADKMVKDKMLSVVDKGRIPDSGDKHDYMSMAPYWWPNPETEDSLPYVRKDGERNPGRLEISDHSYFSRATTSIFELSLAYYLSGNKKYAEKAVQYLNYWFLDSKTKMNPNLNYAQAVKGMNNGRGSGVLEGRGLIFVVDALGILKHAGGIDDKTYSAMKKWLTQYLKWMLESKNGKSEYKAANNHGSWYDAQVVSYALFAGDTVTALKHAQRIKERIENQITVDGKQPAELVRTNSFSYSFFNLEALAMLSRLSESLNINGWNYSTQDGKSMIKALEYMYPYALNEIPWTHQQISERGTDGPARVFLYAYFATGEKKYYQAALSVKNNDLHDIIELLYL